jgi:HKD family nuclease
VVCFTGLIARGSAKGEVVVKVAILKPVDQAVGKKRLLHELEADLKRSGYSELRIIVAYAKVAPLIKLRPHIDAWRKKSRTVRGIYGIDQRGTSREALELALAIFDEVYITNERSITFHPKAYVFRGASKARLYLGSNNLTVGGTETNFEASVVVDLKLPTDHQTLREFDRLWSQLLPKSCPATYRLNPQILAGLVQSGDVIDEAAQRKLAHKGQGKKSGPSRKSGLVLKPPSPLPKSLPASSPAPVVAGPGAAFTPTVVIAASGHALHIRPHGNGEIHLSTLAARDNPGFFGLPFTGLAQPKKAKNKPYRYRDPRPKVDIDVYGTNLASLASGRGHELYMINYSENSEIRITSRTISDVAPAMSILIMTAGERSGIDYQLTVHTPASPEYAKWNAVCNKPMPGGRRYGWF